MTPTSPLDPTAGRGQLDAETAAVLVELSGSIETVRPKRSRWTLFVIAAFTGLTCLGLAGTTLFPRVTDRGIERRDAPSATAGTPASHAATAASGAAGGAAPSPVVATWRLVGAAGHRQLFVSGAASRHIERIAVAVSIGGRTVATADVLPDGQDRRRDDVVPWSVVMDMPDGAAGADSVATVAVTWAGSLATAGSFAAAVVLGDGRGASAGR